ncbi:MAG: hypothetical protein ACLT0W_06675 [Clostridium sp.]
MEESLKEAFKTSRAVWRYQPDKKAKALTDNPQALAAIGLERVYTFWKNIYG